MKGGAGGCVRVSKSCAAAGPFMCSFSPKIVEADPGALPIVPWCSREATVRRKRIVGLRKGGGVRGVSSCAKVIANT